MKDQFLKLKPIAFKCPYCGNWHRTNKFFELEFYDYFGRSMGDTPCPVCGEKSDYRFMFMNDKFYYQIGIVCPRINDLVTGNVPIFKFKEHFDKPNVTIDIPCNPCVPNILRDPLHHCRTCPLQGKKCESLQLAAPNLEDHKKITLGFKFDPGEYESVRGFPLMKNFSPELLAQMQANR